MGWSNMTYLAARAQVNTFGEEVIFLYEDGTYCEWSLYLAGRLAE